MVPIIFQHNIDLAVSYVKWPVQSTENFISCSVPIIAFVASNKLVEVSAFFSLLWTLGALVCVKFYHDSQRINLQQVDPARKSEARQNDQMLTTYVRMDSEEVHRIYYGDPDKKEEYERKKVIFLRVCTFFDLSPDAFLYCWHSHASNSEADYKGRREALGRIFPKEKLELLVKLGLMSL